MAQTSLEVVKNQERCVLGIELPDFITFKECAVEKASFGKKFSKLVKSNVNETRSIQEVKNIQNFRQYFAVF